MSVRSVNSQVMISLHATCFGVVLHLQLEGRMCHPPNYTVKTANTTGMLRLTALILWMSSESTVDGSAIPTLLLDHVALLSPLAILTDYRDTIPNNRKTDDYVFVGSEMTSAMCSLVVLSFHHKLRPTAPPFLSSVRIKHR
jgi:hypothetical protein